ncbi:MAG: outer spore coat protein CotE [Bacilli bacterium]|nr:outer spore coat protein CotE [Bacilli bacterium]
MTNYREIVAKAVIAKGKKSFVHDYEVALDKKASTILGCWVINHNFTGVKSKDTIRIDGSYDVNIWYSYDNDKKTEVVKQTNTYQEVVHMRSVDTDCSNEEIIVRSLKQPNCTKMEINGDKITYSIEKEMGIELVGDVKVKVETSAEEENWEEIEEEQKIDDVIDQEVKEDYI